MICIVLQSGLYGDSFTSKISKAGSKHRMEEHRYQGQSRCISQKLDYPGNCGCCFVLILQRFCMPWCSYCRPTTRGIDGFRVAAFLAVVVPMLYSVMGCLPCYCWHQYPSSRYCNSLKLICKQPCEKVTASLWRENSSRDLRTDLCARA